jgi:hypothetical protein
MRSPCWRKHESDPSLRRRVTGALAVREAAEIPAIIQLLETMVESSCSSRPTPLRRLILIGRLPFRAGCAFGFVHHVRPFWRTHADRVMRVGSVPLGCRRNPTAVKRGSCGGYGFHDSRWGKADASVRAVQTCQETAEVPAQGAQAWGVLRSSRQIPAVGRTSGSLESAVLGAVLDFIRRLLPGIARAVVGMQLSTEVPHDRR